jgi:hypothetical protein
MSKYRALVGLDYPPGKRAEPGDVVDDLPEKSVKWLLKDGKIEEVGQQKSEKPTGGKSK